MACRPDMALCRCQQRDQPPLEQPPGRLDDLLLLPGDEDAGLPVNPVVAFGPAVGLSLDAADAPPRDGQGVGRRLPQLGLEGCGMFGMERFQGRGRQYLARGIFTGQRLSRRARRPMGRFSAASRASSRSRCAASSARCFPAWTCNSRNARAATSGLP